MSFEKEYQQKEVWSWKVKNSKGIFEPYSGNFKSRKDAMAWYEKHGKVLESTFDRKLYLK